MVDSFREKENDYEAATEPIGGAENTNNPEALDATGDEKEIVEVINQGNSSESSHSRSDLGEDEKGPQPALVQTQTNATGTSAVTRTDSHVDIAVKKPWHKKLNPLKWGKIPPVPTEREVSREYHASFLSAVYFQWMAPLMSVSLCTII